MSYQQTQCQCPQCLRIYRVSVTQLTLAQGMVCCLQCLCRFDAFNHFVNLHHTKFYPVAKSSHHQFLRIQAQAQPAAQLFEIFNRRIQHSHLNLEQYLNHLSPYHKEPFHFLPVLNLAVTQHATSNKNWAGTIDISYVFVLLLLMLLLCGYPTTGL